MTDLNLKPMRQFPSFVASEDALGVVIPVERLTDQQARDYWVAQVDHFLAHVRKRRATPAAMKGMA